MIPVAVVNKKAEMHGYLVAENVQLAATNVNIVAVTYLGYDKMRIDSNKHKWRVTVAALTMQAVPGMKVVIANTLSWDGVWEVASWDTANNRVDFWCSVPSTTAGGAVGTITASGVCPDNDIVAGTAIINRDGQLVAYSYTTNQSFVKRFTSVDGMNPVVQVNNTGTQQVTVTITYSLDKVNWLAFPTPIAAVVVAAGASGGFILNQFNMNDIFIRIDIVVTAGAIYHVIAR